MNPELIRDEAQTLPGRVMVWYGEAKSVNRDGSIGTTELISCVGTVLMNSRKVALAHVPVPDRFAVFDERWALGTRAEARTFSQVMSDLFLEFGPISEDTEAIIIGGIEGVSSQRVEEIEKALRNKGITNIKRGRPNRKGKELDVDVKQGEVVTVSRKRPSGYGRMSS